MSRIQCCKDCVPPKRHLGCHSTCPEYLKESADWEARKEKIRKAKEQEYLGIPRGKRRR